MNSSNNGVYSKSLLFLNNIKKTKRLSNNYFSLATTNKISETIDSIQKILKMYEKTKPIIEQSLPAISNIKTTFMVAKAFKKISSQQNIEEVLDLLPDQQEKNNSFVKQKDVEKVAKPYFPWYN